MVPLDTFIQAGDRTLDLNDLGVNLTETFDSLLSPSGVVNQFALSVVIQIIFIVGYLIAGIETETRRKVLKVANRQAKDEL